MYLANCNRSGRTLNETLMTFCGLWDIWRRYPDVLLNLDGLIGMTVMDILSSNIFGFKPFGLSHM